MVYILKDISRYEGRLNNKELDKAKDAWAGHALFGVPENQWTLINVTGPIGSTASIYYPLVFQLRKWMYNVQMSNEWIEVSPVHQQYYQLTHKQKEDLETRIKSALASVAQSVSDLELLEHDLRKYKEFLDYLHCTHSEKTGDVFEKPEPDNKKEKEEWKKEKRSGEHEMKALFIDQVDFHAGSAGQGAGRLSMSFMQQQNIMPSIVQDFFEMEGLDDLEKSSRLKNIPTVEKNMLKTKWIAYQEWRRLFDNEIKKRFKNIFRLVESRRSSVVHYREWLRPYIARHRILEEGFQVSGGGGGRGTTLTSFVHSSGQAVASNGIIIWAWREYLAPELYRTPGEMTAKARLEGAVPWDDWTMKNLIMNKDTGLKAEHTWIDEDWVYKKIKQIDEHRWLDENRPYYSFFDIDYRRTNIKFASGAEIEDADFTVNHFILSQNIVFVKLLEVLAKQDELERYINELIGFPATGEVKDEKKAIEEAKEAMKKPKEKEKKPLIPASVKEAPQKFFSFFDMGLKFAKAGPYERDLNDRITKSYMKAMAVDRFLPLTGFIKEKAGFVQ
ncbi:MAG: hypothetical protein HZB66_02540 [Candidatus Aenigmarchaeota archaeon]|nr:hypothetical protein [Candidatus Aenigmarchaeota archaeon]